MFSHHMVTILFFSLALVCPAIALTPHFDQHGVAPVVGFAHASSVIELPSILLDLRRNLDVFGRAAVAMVVFILGRIAKISDP
jgi:hypothetical protein